MNSEVTLAIVPVAGSGTRMYPATRAIPKAMLPIVDRPAIEYVAEEALLAGIPQIAIVCGADQPAVRQHFAVEDSSVASLRARGENARADATRRSSQIAASVSFVEQPSPEGLGDAVNRASAVLGSDAPVALLLADDLLPPSSSSLRRMLQVHRLYGGSVVALVRAPTDVLLRSGVVLASEAVRSQTDVIRIRGLAEKPQQSELVDDLAVVGRYILSPRAIGRIGELEHGNSEARITDAINSFGDEVEPVHGVVIEGDRYDIGTHSGYLKAQVAFGCQHDEFGPEFVDWISRFNLAGRNSTPDRSESGADVHPPPPVV